MLNIGWSEMLIVAAIALIVVGPKDLPAMLRQLGRVFGTVRRMGNEFKSEISKVAALDEIKDIKSSVTQPLQDTHKELTDQFNTIGKEGVEPSGAIKPAVEGQESVANEIRESAGLSSTPAPDPDAAASSMKSSIARAQADAAEKKKLAAQEAAKQKTAAAKKPVARKRASAKTATASKSTTAKTTAAKTAAAKKAPAKRTATKKPAAKKPAASTAHTAKATAARKAPAKTAAKPKRAPRKPATTPKGEA